MSEPCPTGPTCTILRVRTSSTGVARSRSASSAPTSAMSCPSAAGPTVPETGESMNRAPCSSHDAASSLAVLARRVLISMKSLSSTGTDRRPSGPLKTSRAASSPLRTDNTTSVAVADGGSRQPIGLLNSPVPHGQGKPGVEQSLGHGQAHLAQSKKSQFHCSVHRPRAKKYSGPHPHRLGDVHRAILGHGFRTI